MTARRARRGVGLRSRSVLVTTAALALVAGFVAGVWWAGRDAPPPTETPPTRAEPRPPARPVEQRPVVPDAPPPAAPAAPGPAPIRAAGGARVAIVIDDLGRSVADVENLAELGIPLSYGVLPFETRTAEVIDELNRRGAEVLCHLPMEPSNDADPGPGALTGDMSAGKLRRGTRSAVAATRGAVGVNNHMGSGLTANGRKMRPILEEVAALGLFFLDSRTSSETVGYSLALELGVPAAERQVFLDPDAEAETITLQFRRLLDLARRDGAAIGIGHPHPVTVEVLRRELPAALAAGYEFVPVSFLVNRTEGVLR